MPNSDFKTDPATAEAVKRAYEEAQLRGSPLAALAEQIANQIQMKEIEGEVLGTPIPDEGILANFQVEVPADPQFFIDAEGRTRDIQLIPGPNDIFQQAKVTVEQLTCPECGDTQHKEGFQLVPLDFEPTHIAQCGNCFRYLWITAKEKEEPNEN
jgi:hypothetical protein